MTNNDKTTIYYGALFVAAARQVTSEYLDKIRSGDQITTQKEEV
ncbi:hypothetical protein RLOatenuis_2830 [Rickettsiales bacterium]|nr:hypothetical protein RLOatenuis_2830 [Rickettsiales bacterium]